MKTAAVSGLLVIIGAAAGGWPGGAHAQPVALEQEASDSGIGQGLDAARRDELRHGGHIAQTQPTTQQPEARNGPAGNAHTAHH